MEKKPTYFYDTIVVLKVQYNDIVNYISTKAQNVVHIIH